MDYGRKGTSIKNHLGFECFKKGSCIGLPDEPNKLDSVFLFPQTFGFAILKSPLFLSGFDSKQ